MTTLNPLEYIWPYELDTGVDWKSIGFLTSSFQIGPFDPDFNGFVISCLPDFDDLGALEPCSLIPRQYKNGLRLLNSKASYLQQCAQLLSAPAPKETSPEGLQNIHLARDSVLRFLFFTATVREELLEDLNLSFNTSNAFKKKRKKPVKRLDDSYRFVPMDFWLYCEFRWGRHDPIYVNERLKAGWEKLELLNNGE
jgi:hypothetical protein